MPFPFKEEESDGEENFIDLNALKAQTYKSVSFVLCCFCLPASILITVGNLYILKRNLLTLF